MIKTMPAAKKMPDPKEQFIDVADLRIGLYVYIDLGWISHPFPLNSFKIHSPEQIATIRTLGIDRIRYSPEKSDPEPVVVEEIKAPPAPASPLHCCSQQVSQYHPEAAYRPAGSWAHR